MDFEEPQIEKMGGEKKGEEGSTTDIIVRQTDDRELELVKELSEENFDEPF